MTLEPLLEASTAIQIHVATVVPAFVLGTWQIFLSRKGSPLHRTIGWAYLALMTATAIAAIFVHAVVGPTFMGFGLIHLFVPLTFWGVYNAIVGARRHNVRQHASAMIGLYVGGLLIAGGLTFLPGRVMHNIFMS